MRILSLKKFYPYINQSHKNIKWSTVDYKKLSQSTEQIQMTCNCFFNATKTSLYNSTNGKNILLNRIKAEKDNPEYTGYKIILSPNGKKDAFRITKKDYVGKFFDIYKKYFEITPGIMDFKSSDGKLLNIAMDIAISKMIKKYPNQKPWYLRLYGWPDNKKYEYNRPSQAFEWLTGIKPIQFGEEGYFCNLKKHKKEVLSLLEELGNMSSKDYSFILMSGPKVTPKTEKWHCLPITKVDNKKKRIYFIDKRSNKEHDISYDTLFFNYKAIVGINWKKINV